MADMEVFKIQDASVDKPFEIRPNGKSTLNVQCMNFVFGGKNFVSLNAHMKLDDDGLYRVNLCDLYLSRPWGCPDVTRKQRSNLKALLEKAVNFNHAFDFKHSGLVFTITSELERAKGEYEAAQKAFAKASIKLTEANNTFADLTN